MLNHPATPRVVGISNLWYDIFSPPGEKSWYPHSARALWIERNLRIPTWEFICTANNHGEFKMKTSKKLLLLLICLILFQSCNYNGSSMRYKLKWYPSSDSVKNLFLEHRSDFMTIAKLLEEKTEFFFQNDQCLFPRKNYRYSQFFTEGEWQRVQDFLVLTGLYNIRLDPISVGENEEDRRYGQRIKFSFSLSEPGVRCTLAYLSSSDDEDMKNEMIKQWHGIHDRLNSVEMEELGEGWFFFTHYELPDPDATAQPS